ncbi:barstar family protein [Roseibium sp.]|uniref:barstar family protein n=1 Tax=Roseibium sp. TaxID=1936156 RepID=UPI003BB194FE
MKTINVGAALSGNCRQALFKIASTASLPIHFAATRESRTARVIFLDSSKLTDWPGLVETIGSKLDFQNTSARGYDFGLDAFLDCLRDAIDGSPDGLILVFRNADQVLRRDRKYRFSQLISVFEDSARYSSQLIQDGEWWDRGPVYFRVIFETSGKLPLPQIAFA